MESNLSDMCRQPTKGRVQSGSDKIKSNPILIRKIFENPQSDPVLVRPCKVSILILPHDAKALLELFCL